MEKIIQLSTSDHHPSSLDEGLVVDAVEKKYRKKVVLRGISMQIRKGEVIGLLGPNGAGKTTARNWLSAARIFYLPRHDR